MKGRRHWHKRYHNDALNGYMGLTPSERGIYTTCLDLIYSRGTPLLGTVPMASVGCWMVRMQRPPSPACDPEAHWEGQASSARRHAVE